MLRLSDVTGERSLDVVAEIIDPICRIALDPEANRFFKRERLKKGENATTHAITRVQKYVPTLLKSHKTEIYEILGAISGKGVEGYLAEGNAVTIFNDCLSLLGDPAFRSLFFSAVPSPSTESGTGSDDTAEQAAPDTSSATL